MKHESILFRMISANFLCCIFLLLFMQTPANSQTVSWEQLSGSPTGTWALAFHPNGTIFSANFYNGLSRSTDNGTTWTDLTANLPNSYVPAIAIDSTGTIYVGTGTVGTPSPILRSTDLGDHWVPTNFPNIAYPSDIRINAQGDVFVVMATNEVYRSVDHGDHWTLLPIPLKGERLWALKDRLDVNGSGTLYYVWTKGFYVSTDNGNTWIRRRAYGRMWTDYVVKSGSAGTVYLGVRAGTARQSIQLMAWKKGKPFRIIMHAPVGGTIPPISDIVATGDIKTIFVGVRGSGVLGTVDGGKHWLLMNQGFDPTQSGVSALVLGKDGKLYAGTAHGVYRTVSSFAQVTPNIVSQSVDPEEPSTCLLEQNYPNPFNPTTTIEFELEQDALVTVEVYNTLGQEVAMLADRETFGEGINNVEFDGSNLPSGVYYYRIIAQDIETGQVKFVNAMKMLLVK